MSLSADADIAAGTDLLGKSVSDLQTSIVVDNDDEEITGTLKKVTGYTGYSGDPAEQSGNYLALHFAGETGAIIRCSFVGGSRVVTLDSDGLLISRITDKDAQKIFVETLKDGYSWSKTYDLSGLTLLTE